MNANEKFMTSVCIDMTCGCKIGDDNKLREWLEAAQCQMDATIQSVEGMVVFCSLPSCHETPVVLLKLCGNESRTRVPRKD